MRSVVLTNVRALLLDDSAFTDQMPLRLEWHCCVVVPVTCGGSTSEAGPNN
jgi:hypothetical protein